MTKSFRETSRGKNGLLSKQFTDNIEKNRCFETAEEIGRGGGRKFIRQRTKPTGHIILREEQ